MFQSINQFLLACETDERRGDRRRGRCAAAAVASAVGGSQEGTAEECESTKHTAHCTHIKAPLSYWERRRGTDGMALWIREETALPDSPSQADHSYAATPVSLSLSYRRFLFLQASQRAMLDYAELIPAILLLRTLSFGEYSILSLSPPPVSVNALQVASRQALALRDVGL